MKKYSKYINKHQKLYIIVQRWCDVVTAWNVKTQQEEKVAVPTRIELLNVEAEKSKELTWCEMENLVTTGKLKKLN